MKDFTLHDVYKALYPDTPDTWSVGIRMAWADRPDYYSELSFDGYTSSDNAIAAADVFSSLGEDITYVFHEKGQQIEYNGQKVDVSIKRVPGVQNGGVRY
jgi:hypothetical protein